MRDYVKGMEVYVELTIGKAPWPMGVTSVGIHERAAREKIFEAGSTVRHACLAHDSHALPLEIRSLPK